MSDYEWGIHNINQYIMLHTKIFSRLLRILMLLLIFVFGIQAALPVEPVNAKKKASGDVVFPEIKDWKLVQEYPVYYPENLWDYINGAADAYLSYLFVDLHIAEYVNAEGTIIKAEVYRHRAPEYAFGIYSIERTPEYDFQEYGTQGYAEESLVHFITGDYYVKVTTNASGDEIGKIVPVIARKVAECLGESGPMPEPLYFFPEKGKIKNSEKFIADNFLGHQFMSRVFTADYRVGEDEFILFFMEKDSPKECKKMLEEYYAFTKQTVDLIEGHHTITDRYNGTLHVIWDGNCIWGVMNVDDPDIGKKYLDLMGSKIR